ncbi:MAG: hypothetical protein K2W78_06025 [Xanthobacteraceae bacterium]|nr:hypothetical protein [Xanthobacteraceae bacterium]
MRALVGKREEKKSLQTKDPAIAKLRHAEALAELEGRWANLREGNRSLSERDAHSIAAAWHDRWIEEHKNNPNEQSWPKHLTDAMTPTRD